MTLPDAATRPSRVPWPPILYASSILCAAAGQLALPLHFPARLTAALALLGIVCLGGGAGLGIAAIRRFRRAGTTVSPNRAAEKLVTDGPFSFSRNPMYLGNTLALIGLALIFDVPWFLVVAPAAMLCVQELAIKREEAHLAAKFGAEWASYAARVRRWL